MSLFFKKFSKTYNYIFEELADPRCQDFFLVRSPLAIFGILGFYLYFVFKLGPKLMQNRRPFNLDKLLIVYNLGQILVCGFLIYQSVVHVIFTYNWRCQPIDYSNTDISLWIARNVWFYYMLKVVDLLDTVFFVLRKKNNQITFLHVYHHTGMALLGWGATKYIAGGSGLFVGVLNCIVHIVMYTYYLLTAWDKEYKKSIWWKKHITQLQLVQFFLLIVMFVQILLNPTCNYPKWTCYIFIPQNVFMIVLFSDFYWKAYVKPKKARNSVTSTAQKQLNENGKLKSG